MHIRRLDPGAYTRAYDISAVELLPWPDGRGAPFGAMLGVVARGERTRRHNHYEAEVFVILGGRGVVRCDGPGGSQQVEVSAGDVIYVTPLDAHELENESAEDLRFLSFWWGDPAMLQAIEPAPAPIRPTLITATPPTPNGDLHLGHLSGPYLGADILRRQLAQHGADACFVTGIDDHQNYVDFLAQKVGQRPAQTAASMGDRMCQTWTQAHVAPDFISRPAASQHHQAQCRAMITALWEAGKVVLRDRPSLHCVRCNRYLFGAWVSGQCPHCERPCNGGACEDCGRPNDCADLNCAVCNGCGQVPQRRTTRRLYLPLSPWAQRLSAFHASVQMPPRVRALCAQMLRDGLPEICVSHPGQWGLPVGIAELGDQRLDAWIEMASGYVAACLGAGRQDLLRDSSARRVQFFGFDNAWYHAILFPALYMAWDAGVLLPTQFVVNEFYRLEGRKFSTSSAHAIWGGEILPREGADAIRYHLALTGPERSQTDFQRREFEATRRELRQLWSAWLAEVSGRIGADFEGRAPEPGTWTDEHHGFFRRLGALIHHVGAAYDVSTFSPRRAAAGVRELVLESGRMLAGEREMARAPGAEDAWRTTMALQLAAVATLAMLAEPLLPELAARLRLALGLSEARWHEVPQFVAAGTVVGELAEVLTIGDA